MSPSPFESLGLADLRKRRSAKWVKYPADVLPAWVAEMDFPLAPSIRDALTKAVDLGDTGYPDPGSLAEALGGFMRDRFSWEIDPNQVRLVADVMSGIRELLLVCCAPGDGVVISPPVYPPFHAVPVELGLRLVEAPLRKEEAGWSLDLGALEQAFSVAKAFLLCHPHNPTGTSFSRETLESVAALAARHGVIVLSDEIHAPMTMPGATHVPFLTVGADATEWGIALTSASKSWNLAGLKAAVIVSGSDAMRERVARLPPHIGFHAGHFGVLASVAAFEAGGEWLDGLVRHLDGNRRLLADLLDAHLPGVHYEPPDAGYLAWIDLRCLEVLGDDPAAVFLEHGRVALSAGPTFGTQGRGWARLNVGTSTALLEEAVRRMAQAVSAVSR